jgi:hypothetical protein
VTEFVSIDEAFEDADGAEGYEYGGWTFEYDRDEDGDQFKLDELLEAQVQLLARCGSGRRASADGVPDNPRPGRAAVSRTASTGSDRPSQRAGSWAPTASRYTSTAGRRRRGRLTS